jgi:cell division protein FtsW
MPVIGVMLNGAKRWINCFFFIAQPIEIFKPFFIVMCAKFFIKQYFQPHRMLIGFIIISFVTSVVLLLQPDYGQMIILLTTGFLMFVSTQKNIKMIVSISFIGSIILGALALAKPYRIKRILIFLNPFDDPQGKGFQIIQSLIAISKGGFWGCGIGYSQQKVSYLPMQHTDFIFSIICEEIGIFGGIIIVGFFIIIATVLCYISMRIKDPCSSLIVLGISYMFLIQSGINILVATASLPTKGIGLPLISYGISSLIGYGICFGIVYLCINDDKKNKYYEYLT